MSNVLTTSLPMEKWSSDQQTVEACLDYVADLYGRETLAANHYAQFVLAKAIAAHLGNGAKAAHSMVDRTTIEYDGKTIVVNLSWFPIETVTMYCHILGPPTGGKYSYQPLKETSHLNLEATLTAKELADKIVNELIPNLKPC